ncbi:3-hydroxyacyl-ACP dehydratase FabZ family protein [Kutzneria sp. NPDC052558]|uniref:3-hydroxyacyl-ACP dehydratase FabZ family protein n=1 Tax=Kutzneria sp. NPDC052558 TaxID=3364121 RepID=UPI0037C8D2C4
MITRSELRRLLPHRYPILLVDRVLEVVPGERITTVKAVTCNEPWYADLGDEVTDEELAYPSTLLVESWAQSAGVLATLTVGGTEALHDKVMLLGSVSGVDFHGPVLPGDVVEHRIGLHRVMGETMIFQGESRVAGRTVVTVTNAVMAFRPADQLRPEKAGVIGEGIPA